MKAKVALSVGVVALLLAACGTTADPADEDGLRDVSLRLDFIYGSDHAGYFAALENGYYEDVGLNVSIEEGSGSSVSARLVGTGEDTFGAVGASVVLTAVSQGVPIKAVATMVPETPTGVVFPATEDATSLEWMEGKRIGAPVASFVYNEFQAVIELAGLDRRQISEVHTDSLITEPLLAGRIDGGIGVSYVDGILPELQGTEVGMLMFSDFGLSIPSLTLTANNRTIEEEPELVAAFVEASLRGWEWARENPEEAMEIFLQHNPDADEEYNRAKFPLVIDHMFAGEFLGHNDADTWSNLIEIYSELDLLATEVGLDDIYTNDFLPDN